MERIQLNINSPVYGTSVINVTEAIERDNWLVLTISNRATDTVSVGDKIYIKRYIPTDNGYETISQGLNIEKKEGKKLYVNVPTVEDNFIVKNKNLENSYTFISGYTEDKKKYEYYVLDLVNNHNIFGQDLDCGKNIVIKDADGTVKKTVECGQKIYLKNYSNEILGEYDNLKIPNAYTKEICKAEDCLELAEQKDTCGNYNYSAYNIYKYSFLPSKFSRKSIIISGASESVLSGAYYVNFKYNPFYYYYTYKKNDGKYYEKDLYGNPIKHCVFYGDVWWDTLKNDPHNITCGETYSQIVKSDSAWKLNIGLENSNNEKALGVDNDLGNKILSDIKESLIPDYIDMERVKYSPMVISNDNLTIATSITFDFHFRQRVSGVTPNSANTELTQNNTYNDGWYVYSDSGGTTWWNGYKSPDIAESSMTQSIADFISASGRTSDLIGYLNFLDDDIFYRKKKVSKSFIRLSFYTSKNSVDQKLLFYSTIFVDGGELYGKYLKQKEYVENNTDVEIVNDLNKYAQIVFCNNSESSGRVDTKMTVTNEYDRTKSSEGFNLYLFASDSSLKDDEENDYRTIYMKVEFNHAGNGKTIPMILWPKDKNGNYTSLTIDNFIDNLYIPVKIRYFNNKYVYYIEGAENEEDKSNIELILFEPKLDVIENITENGDN